MDAIFGFFLCLERADVWEAWWGAILAERELFNDSLDGIYSVLRHLVHIRYRIIETYSTSMVVSVAPEFRLVGEVSPNKTTFKEVSRRDPLIEESAITTDEDCPVFGYVATVSFETHPPNLHYPEPTHTTTVVEKISAYGITSDLARSRTLYLAKVGGTGTLKL